MVWPALEVAVRLGASMSACKFSLAELRQADEDQEGFCIECGEPRECCEPDAREYPCSACGALAVYGAQEIVIMGLVSEEGE